MRPSMEYHFWQQQYQQQYFRYPVQKYISPDQMLFFQYSCHDKHTSAQTSHFIWIGECFFRNEIKPRCFML